MIQHGNGGGSKSAHGNTGHHFEPGVGWKYTHGDTEVVHLLKNMEKVFNFYQCLKIINFKADHKS
jgi:hypothetical protein